MTLTIDIPPNLEGRLCKEAERRGVAAEELACKFLEERLPSPAETPLWERPTEWKTAFKKWVESHDPDIPALSDDAMSRESIYGKP